MNKILIEWNSKSQYCVETFTYVSEYDAAYICTDHIVDLCNTIFYIGVPLQMVNGSDSSFMFGDNLSVVNSTLMTASKLQHRYNILNYNFTKEAQAKVIIKFVHMSGNDNTAITAIYSRVSNTWFLLMKPLLFWRDM